MALGGFANRIAHVNLTAGTVEYRGIPEDWARKYIGARGLGVRYMLENGPRVDPLSPDNLLCFMNGPLTGTEANMSGRMAIVTKSPLTGTVTDSHHGGWSAARLRWAGFDGILVKGKASAPVYLYVHDDIVEIRDASEVWGKGVHETVRFFRERYGEKDLSVIAIGQAGENLVRFACWVNEDDRASGRGGTGCVGGSKLLKAIVIKAPKKMPKAANLEAWKPAHKRALSAIMDERNITSPRKGGLSVYGTNVLMNITSTMGALPTKNSTLTSFGPGAEKISGEYVKEHILVDDPTCHACPVACKKEVEIKEGPWKGLRMESLEYEPAWSLGANCGNDDVNAVAKLIDLCNDYGMDAIETGHPISIYMEATERGYTNGDGGLVWGDTMGMVELVRKIAFREGIGNVMANGADATAKYFGHPELAMTVKGQGVPAYDPRGLKGMGIAYATSNRGACHLRAYTPAAELGVTPLGALKVDPLAWKGKGELTKIFQDLHAFSDSLDLCKFSAFAEGAEEYAAQYSAMVGVECTAEDVLKIGERIYNLERYYNNLAGFGPGSDYLPARFTQEPSTMPGSQGHVCELDDMLAEYYAARGWENGVVPESKLRELGILD
ncbi:aldehyde ferredoxin oxidoreductase family protein [Roseiflexus castenholzii]|uniref:Aldehyde ferredoxin oxidoreductase n=1 Tax=Roseiflexus castenholzii (strain DSM 13941 / HLO8) TaxID=383372 RepID=A7NKD4_ROSCS|nr:aldehyde ferredoxin oxidoreductase family protein [Roseiflexus castenholzii]ABU57954.1 Aldehyde ferredoxin oxidoreductase [Roseiflexus castenholzii DSM 13941]